MKQLVQLVLQYVCPVPQGDIKLMLVQIILLNVHFVHRGNVLLIQVDQLFVNHVVKDITLKDWDLPVIVLNAPQDMHKKAMLVTM